MKSNVIPAAETMDDARLVALGRDGQREAFGQLVARHQSAVCALAYSACGNIPQSEDLAQETFIIAWQKLRDLKEPARFKWWLYGIARNLISNAWRRQSRNPLAAAEPLDENLPVTTPLANPAGHAISKEEQEILWRSLEQIPETYREPLVLFYRENESIERVAEIMNLSEEAARQRLSRGRKLLQDQVQAFVEGALRQTVPSQAFTLGVMSVLPNLAAATGSSAAGGATGKAVATVSGLALAKSLLAKFAPPLFSVWAMLKATESKRERMFMIKAMAGLFFVALVIYPAILKLVTYLGRNYLHRHPQGFTLIMLGLAFGFIVFVGPFSFWMARVQRGIRKEEGQHRAFSVYQNYEYRSAATFLGLPLVHIYFGEDAHGKIRVAKGWIAIGTKAYGILYAAGGVAVGGISCGACAVGIIAIGGFGFGVFAFGGMALGIAAIGGGAIGYLAFGGGAVGWLGATGGAVVAKHYATGGGVIAEHANDQVAYAFMQNNFFFHNCYHIFFVLVLFSWIVPAGSTLIYKWRRERNARAAQSTP